MTWMKFQTEDPKTVHTTVQNLVAWICAPLPHSPVTHPSYAMLHNATYVYAAKWVSTNEFLNTHNVVFCCWRLMVHSVIHNILGINFHKLVIDRAANIFCAHSVYNALDLVEIPDVQMGHHIQLPKPCSFWACLESFCILSSASGITRPENIVIHLVLNDHCI